MLKSYFYLVGSKKVCTFATSFNGAKVVVVADNE